eukprot:5647085-Amphidinium_carterae.1
MVSHDERVRLSYGMHCSMHMLQHNARCSSKLSKTSVQILRQTENVSCGGTDCSPFQRQSTFYIKRMREASPRKAFVYKRGVASSEGGFSLQRTFLEFCAGWVSPTESMEFLLSSSLLEFQKMSSTAMP